MLVLRGEFAPFLRIESRCYPGRVDEIAKKNGQMATFAFGRSNGTRRGMAGGGVDIMAQSFAAISAKLGVGCVLAVAFRTTHSETASTPGAEFFAFRIVRAASGTAHRFPPIARRWLTIEPARPRLNSDATIRFRLSQSIHDTTRIASGGGAHRSWAILTPRGIIDAGEEPTQLGRRAHLRVVNACVCVAGRSR